MCFYSPSFPPGNASALLSQHSLHQPSGVWVYVTGIRQPAVSPFVALISMRCKMYAIVSDLLSTQTRMHIVVRRKPICVHCIKIVCRKAVWQNLYAKLDERFRMTCYIWTILHGHPLCGPPLIWRHFIRKNIGVWLQFQIEPILFDAMPSLPVWTWNF